jgi:hypothetical protein
MTSEEKNDLIGSIFGIIMIAIPVVGFIITLVSNEACEANEDYCTDYLRCYYYEKGCEEYPDLVTLREKNAKKAAKHDSVWQAKFMNDDSENTAAKVYHIHRAMGKPY